jgi:hypothetical protein
MRKQAVIKGKLAAAWIESCSHHHVERWISEKPHREQEAKAENGTGWQDETNKMVCY